MYIVLAPEAPDSRLDPDPIIILSTHWLDSDRDMRFMKKVSR